MEVMDWWSEVGEPGSRERCQMVRKNATRTVQTTQQLFELLLQTDVRTLFLLQGLLEFQNDLMAEGNIIRQQWDIRSVNILAHALY